MGDRLIKPGGPVRMTTLKIRGPEHAKQTITELLYEREDLKRNLLKQDGQIVLLGETLIQMQKALHHVIRRTHGQSDGCDQCLLVAKMLKVTIKKTSLENAS